MARLQALCCWPIYSQSGLASLADKALLPLSLARSFEAHHFTKSSRQTSLFSFYDFSCQKPVHESNWNHTRSISILVGVPASALLHSLSIVLALWSFCSHLGRTLRLAAFTPTVPIMAGYPGSPGEHNANPTGLESLFAQLRGQRNGSSVSGASASGFSPQLALPTNPYFDPQNQHQTTVSSPLPDPPGNNLPPRHPSAVMSPASDALLQRSGSGSAPNANHTNSLLNLLKFSSPGGASSSASPTPVSIPHPSSRAPSQNNSADLLATLMGNTGPKENSALSSRLKANSEKQSLISESTAASSASTAKEPSADTQAYLLQLLNRPKPAQKDPEVLLEKSAVASSTTTSQKEISDLAETLKDTSIGQNPNFQATIKPPQGLFTYVNPFEQLAASSPRNRTPNPSTPSQASSAAPAMQILKPPRLTGGEATDLKRKVDERSPVSSPAHSRVKMGRGSPTVLPEVKSEAQIPDKTEEAVATETVAEALQEVGEQVGKEVEEALARSEDAKAQSLIGKDLDNMMNARTSEEFADTAQIAAAAIKKELDKEPGVLKEALPADVAEAVKEIVDDTAKGGMPERWDSESNHANENDYAIKVYNFPMKPWISITAQPGEGQQLAVFNDDCVMDVARLKKDFDQIDRTLVTATATFIVYGMSKFGGVRIVRQDDGKDAKLFDQTNDRIFHITIATAPDSPAEAVIAIGISGTVYWAEIRGSAGEQFMDDHLHEHGFALPPIQSFGEEASGGVLKTRARKSNGHLEFFAVGRGKSIHIIWPSVIMKHGYLKNGNDRIVDTEKYLQHRSLKINTGKAGKDFIFSEDDTTIVSLDKAGRVKFWDVSTLTNTERGNDRFPTPEQIQPVEIKDPILTLYTTPEGQKAWPTSLLFIDKHRPYQKGGALRYLIVGLKQNHTLQLWDLGLGKPVQEIHLPHEKESDAICSISYHPMSGILAVGHPTRNSVFFIHLSSPRYNLPKGCTQADFMKRIAKKDPSLPKPDATSVMSGIREYTFSPKGQLRSLDMLQTPIASAADGDDSVLFELYAMHSKGITALAIKQEDMGWNKENRVIAPMRAVEDGFIKIEPLKPPPQVELGSEKSSIAKTSTTKEPAPKEPGQKSAPAGDLLASSETSSQNGATPKATAKVEEHSSTTNGGADSLPGSTERPEKKKKRNRVAAAAVASAQTGSEPGRTGSKTASPVIKANPAFELASTATSLSADKSKTTSNGDAINDVPSTGSGSSRASIEHVVKDVEKTVSREMDSALARLLDRFNIENRKQADQAVIRQQEVIRLVKSSLETNVQNALESIVDASIKNNILPAVSETAVKAVNDHLDTKFKPQMKTFIQSSIQSTVSSVITKELTNILPDQIYRALHREELLKLMSESLANSVAFKVEAEFANVLELQIAPNFIKLVQKATAEMDRRHSQHIAQLERQTKVDSLKIDQLSTLVTGLGEAISAMASSQSKYQGEFLKFQQQTIRERQANQVHGRPGSDAPSSSALVRRDSPPTPSAPQRSEEELTLDAVIQSISEAMNEGDYETACMAWLQIDQNLQHQIFEVYFSKFEPAFVHEISPLMLLSVGSVVTQQLEGRTLVERLSWLEVILHEFQGTFETAV